MAVLLNCQSIGKTFGTRPLFENLTFGMNDGERLGIIGPNGSGKSTLLKILAGIETADTGVLNIRRQLRMGYVPQEDSFEHGATAETVLTAAMSELHLDEHEIANRVDVIISKIVRRMAQGAG
jgi:ABC transport system ATP-binding/permease protein